MNCKPAYFYGTKEDRPRALINVKVGDHGSFPPIVCWRGIIYYWKSPCGGYYSWRLIDDVDSVSESDVIESF